MAHQFTEEQQAAIEQKVSSVALSAGAGSGKTTVLTHRLLRDLDLSLRGQSILRFLAITFTDRAAREMKERLRELCLQEMETAPPHEKGIWDEILNTLDSAAISTIHSFCQGFLKEHALICGLDPLFTVLEGNIASELLEDSVEYVFREIISIA